MKKEKSRSVRRAENPIFISQFSPNWWRAAAGELGNTHKMVVSALLSAIAVVLTLAVVPVAGGNIRVMFTFIVSSLNAMICGPFVGLLWGAVTDVVAFVVFGDGAFFPGYTLSEMLVSFIFALFLYRRPVSFYRILAARAIINLFVNAGLGSLWIVLMGWSTKGYPIQFGLSLVKNMAMLPIETIVMSLLFYSLSPVLVRMKLIPRGERRSFRRRDVVFAIVLSAVLLAVSVLLLLKIKSW